MRLNAVTRSRRLDLVYEDEWFEMIKKRHLTYDVKKTLLYKMLFNFLHIHEQFGYPSLFKSIGFIGANHSNSFIEAITEGLTLINSLYNP